VVFELTESLHTGIGHVDDEHRNLISRINSIAALERSADTRALIAALSGFKADLADHFKSEEAYLRAVNYPELGSHANHHAETIIVLDRLIRNLQDGGSIEGGAANVCYHELISVLLRKDMQFANWLADHPELKQ
jgi:hemerythrin-like metal-binding protein